MCDKSTENRISMLIEVVQNYEFLYDMSLRDFKNNNKKEEAWKEISGIVNMSVEECKKQWKNLRDRFTKEKRGHPSGSGAEESTWMYLDKMRFYNRFTRPRKTHTATEAAPSKPHQTENRPSSSSSASSVWSTVNEIFSPISNGEDDEEDASNSGSGPPSVATQIDRRDATSQQTKRTRIEDVNQTPTTPSLKKRKMDDDLMKVVQVAQQIGKKMEEAKVASTDSNRTFAEYAYSRLSHMSEEEAKEKRRRMLIILEDLEEN